MRDLMILTRTAFAHCAFITVRTIEQFIFNFTEERIQRAPFVFYITRRKSRRNECIIKRFSSLAAKFIDSHEWSIFRCLPLQVKFLRW